MVGLLKIGILPPVFSSFSCFEFEEYSRTFKNRTSSSYFLLPFHALNLKNMVGLLKRGTFPPIFFFLFTL